VLLGSFFFGLGIIFFMFIVSHTALLSRWRLFHEHREAPGWLSGSRKTNHTENEVPTGSRRTNHAKNEVPIYRYDYSFLLPNESMQSGTSYAGDALAKQFTPATLANPRRAQDFTVEYYPRDPRISRIKGTNVYLYSASLLWVGTAPLMGLLMTLGGLAHGRGKIRLLREGALAEATFRSARQIKPIDDDDDSLKIGSGAFSIEIGNPFDKLDKFIAKNWVIVEEGEPTWRVALRKALRNFVLAAVALVGSLVYSLGNHLTGSRFWTKPNMVDAALEDARRWWDGLGWFVTLLSALICVGVAVVPLVIDFRRSRPGQQIGPRKEPAKPGSVEAFREAQVREQELANALGPVLVGAFFATAAGIIAFIATAFLMAMPGSIHGQDWHGGWPAWIAAVLAAATTFVFAFRRAKGSPPPAVDRLETGQQTKVEGTYEFQLPDGRVIQGKDRLPLPTGLDDIRARRVIYDLARPENSERLLGFSPPVRLSQTGQWEWAGDGSWRVRLVLIIIAYTVGPVLGLLVALLVT
jgi:hypothetical protein